MKINENLSEFFYAIGTLVICTLMFLLILNGW